MLPSVLKVEQAETIITNPITGISMVQLLFILLVLYAKNPFHLFMFSIYTKILPKRDSSKFIFFPCDKHHIQIKKRDAFSKY